MNKIIQKIESTQLKDKLPEVNVGDKLKLSIKIVEGEKERVQFYEGFVIAIKGEGVNRSIKVRNIFFGIGVERTILLHSPMLIKIEVLKKGKVRRAKLYYLRDRVGKSATKIKEKVNYAFAKK